MTRWMKWLAFAPLALLLLALGVVQLLRAVAVGDEERSALALVTAPPPPASGVNGFAALYLANHEVAIAQTDAAMAREVAEFERRLEQSASEWGAYPDFQSLPADPGKADSHWPERPAFIVANAPCALAEASCLDKVRASPEATRALLERESERLARVDIALAADHFRSPFPPLYEAPLPAYPLLRLPLVRAALDAVDGRVAESMARSCTLLAASRRFSGDATDLIGLMVFAATAEGAANLLLEVRRAHPEVALPTECTPALAPVRNDDYVICEAMRGEFRGTRSVSRRMDAAMDGSWRPADIGARLYLVDGRLMDAWTAPVFAHACTRDYRDKVREGIVPKLDHQPITASDPTCYGAYVSCVLARIALPSYGQYQHRLLDHAAKLRLALASLALAEGTLTREQALAQAQSPGYSLMVDEAAGTLSLKMRGKPARDESADYRVAF